MNTPNENEMTSAPTDDAATLGFGSLLDEPLYETALDELLLAMESGEGGAYDRVARRYPRYAAPLLDAVLIVLPAEQRLREDKAEYTTEFIAAADAGIAAARSQLGLTRAASASVLLREPAVSVAAALGEERKARGWSLAELARRLYVPKELLLKIERGQFRDWPERLTRAVADALTVSREQARAVLQATGANSPLVTAAAYSARGVPESDLVRERRGATEDFDAEFERIQTALTPEQTAYWVGVAADIGPNSSDGAGA